MEGIAHVDKKGMLNFGEELSLIEDGVDAFLGNNFGFVHFLHGEESACLLHLDIPDFAESALADDLVEVEIVLPDLFVLAFMQF